MKVLKSLLLIAVSAMFVASCGVKGAKKVPGVDAKFLDSASYAIGVSLAQMVKGSGIETVNYKAMNQGFQDVLSDVEKRKVSDEEIGRLINAYISKIQEAKHEEADKREEKFFEENKTKEGVVETESGLQYQIIEPGDEAIKATDQDTVLVHYKGIAVGLDKEFDSSYERDEPVKFPVNAVIPGWSEGVKLVGKGGKIKLWIPYRLGYGDQARSAELPAFSTLDFDVELIDVIPFVEKEEKKK